MAMASRADRRLTAVISGGSSGIGLEIAIELARKGYAVVLLARRPDALSEAKRAIIAHVPSAQVETLSLDVTVEPACEQAIADVIASVGPIDWLITSAGSVEPGLFTDLSSRSHREQMEANYFGTLNLVRPVVAHMKANGGRITMISSAVAFGGVAGYSGYTPGKYAVRGLGETLRVELAGLGISVSVAFPPDTDTPQYAAEQAQKPEVTKRISAGGGLLSARTVARSIVRQAEQGRFMLTPSALMTAFGLFHSLYAPLFRRQQERVIARVASEAAARTDDRS
jgi:3-dehydrosphinganine reductase